MGEKSVCAQKEVIYVNGAKGKQRKKKGRRGGMKKP